ncbi:hypothetical protein CHLNCDRAFT_142394 [Chlorella variabilis]|uniref:Uncharacterized protein n=1 Tax=Chlorella variabilis TaxID=554065 RepID=E1Z8G2_CHLVA|nr:hypothetical protein CHLNCDRAFT_142394 [Chlorella variabilis]EFN58343.1 hypothetical protein CHLNCDRAFT_142394 [Chlorella variabilis]|eukprot:XP_005850445.1 hypothetical protein CHLNCDRAFT_142394 [Chlorella variabilis]
MAGATGEEAFITAEEGGELEGGQVVADLEGEAPDEENMSDGEEEEDEEEGDGLDAADEDDSIHTFTGHTSGVYSVAWSPRQADLVATGGADDRAYIWRVGQEAFEQTGGAVLELGGHTDTVASMAFSADGASLATGGLDGRVKVWEVASGRCTQTLEGPGDAVEWVRWHPKGGVVLVGAADFTAWMWLAQTGACMQVFSGHSGSVVCGSFTPDGKWVVTGGGEGDASLKVWSPKTGECALTVQGHPYHTAGLTCLDIHPDSTAAISGSEDGVPKVVNLSNGRVVASLAGHEEESSIEAVAFSHHLPHVAMSAGMDGRLMVWDLAAAVPGQRATCQHPDGVTRLAQHPPQPLVFTGCLDGADLAASPDGNWWIAGGEDDTARVFSLLQD